MDKSIRARRLAYSVLEGEWTRPALAERLERALPSQSLDVNRLAARLSFFYEEPPSSLKSLAKRLLDEPLLEAFWGDSESSEPRGILVDSPVMGALPDKLTCFPLPKLETNKDIARWLGVTTQELNWLSDPGGRQASNDQFKMHHYRYRWIDKRSGGQRLLEIPKSQLKSIQRKIQHGILNRVPPHDCAHGFTRGRSCLSYVQSHIDKPVLLHLDLQDFFHTVPVNKVYAFFRTLGYPRGVARTLLGLCTHAVSPELAGEEFANLSWEQRKRLQHKHLPQGAPTSGALANLSAYRLDCRLKGVAKKYGLDYTRYADDLVFSGGDKLRQQADWIEALVGAIATDEGFLLNFRKTRVLTQSKSQRVTGIVVNKKANISRREFDRLKAILNNCQRFGAASQNHNKHPDFKAHMAGVIAHVTWINELKGNKLQQMFDAVDWSS